MHNIGYCATGGSPIDSHCVTWHKHNRLSGTGVRGQRNMGRQSSATHNSALYTSAGHHRSLHHQQAHIYSSRHRASAGSEHGLMANSRWRCG